MYIIVGICIFIDNVNKIDIINPQNIMLYFHCTLFILYNNLFTHSIELLL